MSDDEMMDIEDEGLTEAEFQDMLARFPRVRSSDYAVGPEPAKPAPRDAKAALAAARDARAAAAADEREPEGPEETDFWTALRDELAVMGIDAATAARVEANFRRVNGEVVGGLNYEEIEAIAGQLPKPPRGSQPAP
eukprot:tig00000144_g9041.t1